MNELTHEIIIKIIGNVNDSKTIYNLRLTCKKFANICDKLAKGCFIKKNKYNVFVGTKRKVMRVNTDNYYHKFICKKNNLLSFDMLIWDSIGLTKSLLFTPMIINLLKCEIRLEENSISITIPEYSIFSSYRFNEKIIEVFFNPISTKYFQTSSQDGIRIRDGNKIIYHHP
jgi:hypothetical protein